MAREFEVGDRIRVVAPESMAGGYNKLDIGVVEEVVKSGLRVRWGNGRVSMVFEREVEPLIDDDLMPEVDEPTAWDHYAGIALRCLLAEGVRDSRMAEAKCALAAVIADTMMGHRRGKA